MMFGKKIMKDLIVNLYNKGINNKEVSFNKIDLFFDSKEKQMLRTVYYIGKSDPKNLFLKGSDIINASFSWFLKRKKKIKKRYKKEQKEFKKGAGWFL